MEHDLKYHFDKERKTTRRISLFMVLVSLLIYGAILWNIYVKKPSDDVAISGIAALYHDAMIMITQIGSASFALLFMSITITLIILLSNYKLKLRGWFITVLFIFIALIVTLVYMLGNWIVRVISFYEIEMNAFFSSEIGGWDLTTPLHMLAILPLMMTCVLIMVPMYAAVLIPLKLPDIIQWVDNMLNNRNS